MRPEHEVTLTNGFYLGKYEVTQAQYEAVMTGNTDGLSATPSNWPNNPNRPVEQVSWEDIQKFLTRLNAQEAGNIPARVGVCIAHGSPVGVCLPGRHDHGVLVGRYITAENAILKQEYCTNRDVGQYSANPWGFFDMHGNVWEWTADAMRSIASGAQTDPFNAGATGSSRVSRGGSWTYTGRTCVQPPAPNLTPAPRQQS